MSEEEIVHKPKRHRRGRRRRGKKKLPPIDPKVAAGKLRARLAKLTAKEKGTHAQ